MNTILLVIGLFGFLYSNVNVTYKINYKYSQSLELEEEIRRTYPPEIIEQIKEAGKLTHEFILYTNQEESIIKLSPKIINSQQNMELEIEPDLKWAYKNLRENYIVNLVEFDKKYYVKDSMQNISWRETQEKKEILGYKTSKSFYEDENQIIEIWVADEINIPNGPLNYRGNKQLILESNISQKNGARFSYHFIASKISHLKEYKFIEEKPKKTINKKDFDKIFSEHRKKEQEMNENIEVE